MKTITSISLLASGLPTKKGKGMSSRRTKKVAWDCSTPWHWLASRLCRYLNSEEI